MRYNKHERRPQYIYSDLSKGIRYESKSESNNEEKTGFDIELTTKSASYDVSNDTMTGCEYESACK